MTSASQSRHLTDGPEQIAGTAAMPRQIDCPPGPASRGKGSRYWGPDRMVHPGAVQKQGDRGIRINIGQVAGDADLLTADG